MSKRTTAAIWVKGIAEMLATEGLDVPALLAEARIDSAMSEEDAGYRVTFILFGGDRPVPRQRIEFILVTVIGFCRWISARRGLSAGNRFAIPPARRSGALPSCVPVPG